MQRALLVVVLLAACDLGTAPEYRVAFVDRQPIDPVPDVYPRWYAEVEACVGMEGDFGAVQWWSAEKVYRGGQEVGAVLEWPHDVTVQRPGIMVERIIKHEMVHHVTRQGDEIHDTPLMDNCLPEGLAPVRG